MGQIIIERSEMELHPNNMHRGWPMFSRSLKSLIKWFIECRCPSFPYIKNMVPHPSRMEWHQLHHCDNIYTSFLSFICTNRLYINAPYLEEFKTSPSWKM
jgi:hypothetical protein